MEPKRRRDWVDRISKSVHHHESSRRLFLGRIPRYDPIERLGRGGMGAVFRAMDRVLSREVALKVLVDPLGAPAEARSRFLQEARLAATLQHPHIVPIFDAGEHEGQVFLAMQLIDGHGLERSTLGLREAVSAVRDAARAVHYAHERGIIHRDLKPSNVMVDRTGRVYVTDFGLARRSDSAARMTMTGTIVGTPIYMPPEQARGRETDARSDVYSLGATLYELATGKAPFGGANELEILKHVLLDEPPFPRRHAPSVPQDLEAVIVKAMDKKPTGRYLSAAALADDLDRWLRSEPVEAPVRGTLYWIRKKIVRHRWRVLAIAATIGFLVSSAAFAWAYIRAFRNYHQGMQLKETNPTEALAYFEEAAPYLADARTEREALKRAKEEKERAILAAAEAERKRREKEILEAELEKFRKNQDNVRLQKELLGAIGTLSFPEAWKKLAELERRGFPELKAHHEMLVKAEFDEGVKQLEGFASKGQAADFQEELTKITDARYSQQQDWKNRLIRPCLQLALHPQVRPAEKVEALKKAEDLGERTAQLYESRALLYCQLRRPDLAYQDYQSLLKSGPKTPVSAGFADLLVELASNAKLSLAWKDALAYLNEALSINDKHPRALYLRSVVRYNLKQSAREVLKDFAAASAGDSEIRPSPEHIAAAITELRDVADRTWVMKDGSAARSERLAAVRLTDPVLRSLTGESAGFLLELAKMRLRLGDLENALKDAQGASNSADAHLLRAQVHHLGGRQNRAMIEVNEALRLNQKMAVAWYWRGIIGDVTDASDASNDFKEALRLGFRGPELLTRLSYHAAEESRADDAIRLATEALTGAALSEDEYLAMPADRRGESASDAAPRLRARALAYRGRGHYQKADLKACLEDCNAALELDKTNVDALYHRGLALLKLNRNEEAIADFEKLIALNNRDYQAFAGRGSALWNLKQYDKAKEDFRLALKQAPQKWNQREALELLLRK